jgi:hypothetical protein
MADDGGYMGRGPPLSRSVRNDLRECKERRDGGGDGGRNELRKTRRVFDRCFPGWGPGFFPPLLRT